LKWRARRAFNRTPGQQTGVPSSIRQIRDDSMRTAWHLRRRATAEIVLMFSRWWSIAALRIVGS
jgi:hypothetical protein